MSTARRRDALVALGLAALVLAVFEAARHNGFVEFDDGEYLPGNPVVAAGLTWRGVAWAFTTFQSANWHPLTWLSHMLDVELFGLDPGWHHLAGAGWHAANTALLFAWLRRVTGATWRSALVAALFGVHPLHVESVAWAAERKDLLSGFFWLLALHAHAAHARRPGAGRYALLVAAFAAALLAKPMAVTLPVVLLLLDVWPLRRLDPAAPDRRVAWPLVREKLPLLALSAVSAVVTVTAQAAAGATQTLGALGALPLGARLANASVAAASYLAKAVWPSSLAVFYPHPAASDGPEAWQVAASAALLLAVTAAALAGWRRWPALAVGWGWYLVTLLPVLGLLQVGSQAMADRYTYLPLVGPFLALAFSLPDFTTAGARRLAGGLAAAWLLALASTARAQVAVWRDSSTLFEHAARVTRGNWLAWKNAGVDRFRRGDVRGAAEAFAASVEAWPHDPEAWLNLAGSRSALGDHAAAAAALRRALALRPLDAQAWFLLGLEGGLAGDRDAAAEAEARLEALDPAAADELARRNRTGNPRSP